MTGNDLLLAHLPRGKLVFDKLPSGYKRSHKAIVDRLVESGVTPLEVMIANMRFAFKEAKLLVDAVVRKVNEDSPLSEEQKLVMVDDMREMMRWREIAQACARDAGPYIHPRLASVEVKPESLTDPVTAIKRIIVDGNGPDA